MVEKNQSRFSRKSDVRIYVDSRKTSPRRPHLVSTTTKSEKKNPTPFVLLSCALRTTTFLSSPSSRKLPVGVPARPGRSAPAPPSPQWIHLCVRRVRVDEGRRLEPSPRLSETLKAASVVVFAAAPRDQDRFFWSPQRPKVSYYSCARWMVGSREGGRVDVE